MLIDELQHPESPLCLTAPSADLVAPTAAEGLAAPGAAPDAPPSGSAAPGSAASLRSGEGYLGEAPPSTDSPLSAFKELGAAPPALPPPGAPPHSPAGSCSSESSAE